MPRYHQLGNIPHKRHTVFKKKDGNIHFEQLFGTIGFDGMSSLLYHLHPPTMVNDILSKKNINHDGGWSWLNGSKKKIEFFQKLLDDSIPINKSLNKNPENIAPIARIINGIIMIIGDSCMLDIFNFLLL